MIAPGQSPEWFAEFARRNPGMEIAESGAHVRQMPALPKIDETVMRGTGFRSIDAGRDIRMLTPDGIRRKEGRSIARTAAAETSWREPPAHCR